jgi:hypothetical protein
VNDYLDAIGLRIAAIPPPTFDFATVLSKADRQPKAKPRRSLIAVIVLGIALPIVVAAGVRFVPLQVRHNSGNWQLFGPDETFLHPTPALFSRAARNAPYRIVWPSALPRDDKPFMLATVGSEVFIVVYSCAGESIDRAWSTAVIIPRNYSSVNPKLGNWFTTQVQDHRQTLLWNLANQSVMFGSDCLTDQQITQVRAATMPGASRTK